MVNPNFQLENFILTLDQWGLTDVLLPFILVFAVVFAVLQKMKIFGENSRQINVVIAIVLGLIFVIPHVTGNYPSNYDPVQIINTAIPGVSVVAIAIIMVLILIGLSGWKPTEAKTPWIFFLLAIVAVIYFFGASAGWWYGWNSIIDFFGQDAIALVIIILVFGIIIWFVTMDPSKPKTGSGIFGDIGKWLGGR